MNTYVVIFHGGLPGEKLTADYLSRFADWAKGVSNDISYGNRLKPEGRIISGRNGEVVSEVKFDENLVGGYITTEAEDYEQAVAKLKGCPILENGGTVEVREILPMQT